MIAAIVLAAGSASRMGTPKQLLPWRRGMTLVEYVATQAHQAGLAPVVVVTGAYADRVSEVVSGLSPAPVVAHNPEWQKGMGVSIRAGLTSLPTSSAPLDGLAILLVDQILVTADHLRAMKSRFEGAPDQILAARYRETLGPPAFFRPSTFPALAELPLAAGAKHLFRDQRFRVAPFPLPEAECDVDTPEDFIQVAGPAALHRT